jgi:hypothetical protein
MNVSWSRVVEHGTMLFFRFLIIGISLFTIDLFGSVGLTFPVLLGPLIFLVCLIVAYILEVRDGN